MNALTRLFWPRRTAAADPSAAPDRTRITQMFRNAAQMQLIAGLRELGVHASVVHPIELLDRALGAPVTTGR